MQYFSYFSLEESYNTHWDRHYPFELFKWCRNKYGWLKCIHRITILLESEGFTEYFFDLNHIYFLKALDDDDICDVAVINDVSNFRDRDGRQECSSKSDLNMQTFMMMTEWVVVERKGNKQLILIKTLLKWTSIL